ncbi:MAG TPA: response regulator [Casimicrobiaceae bacterium]|nr:response regulator [Casimicrobiaceae bacterium]
MSAPRILIVDDYAPAADALCRLLRINGHVVRTARDADEAMATALEFLPDVVLLDINLGGTSDGFAVARWLRAQVALDRVLLIAITGRCDFETKDRITAAGFDHFLVKPIPFADIEQIIPGADMQ